RIRIGKNLTKTSTILLIKRGLFLLIYNLSFYFIIIAARSIVSYFYSVEDFALFDFANSLTNAITMFLGSISFLFYPKMLNKFSHNSSSSTTIHLIEKVRKIYLTIAFLIILVGLLVA